MSQDLFSQNASAASDLGAADVAPTAMSVRVNQKRFRLLLGYTILALPLIGWGASKAMQTNANSPIDWVTNRFPARASYDRFREAFGAGDVVILSWPGCTVDSRELDVFAAVLEESRSFYDKETGEWFFESVVTGRAVLRDLTQGPSRLRRSEAVRRLKGTLVGPDGKTTCAIVTLTSDGLKRREQLVRLIRGALIQYCHVPKDEWRMAGPVIDGLSVDVASKNALDRFAIPSSLIVLITCWACLRNLPAALLVFGLSLLSQGATLALVHYSGQTMSALLIVMPPLIQVLAVAAGIHLTNYCLESWERSGDSLNEPPDAQSDQLAERQSNELGETPRDENPTSCPVDRLDHPHDECAPSDVCAGDALRANRQARFRHAAQQAVRLGWLPCLLSAGTTAIGLASLMVSEMIPIRQFGAYGAAGVVLTSGLVLAVIPGVFAVWSPLQRRVGRRTKKSKGRSGTKARRTQKSKKKNGTESQTTGRLGWHQLAHGLHQVRWLSCVLTLGGMLALGLGLPKLQTSVRIETLFSDDSRILDDSRWLEEHVGPLVPIEVVVSFDPECALTFAERLRLVDQIECKLSHLPEVGGTSSAVTSVPTEMLAMIRGRQENPVRLQLPEPLPTVMYSPSKAPAPIPSTSTNLLEPNANRTAPSKYSQPTTTPDSRMGSGTALSLPQSACLPHSPHPVTSSHHGDSAVALTQLEAALRQVRSSNRAIGRRPAKHSPDRVADEDLWRVTARVSALDQTDYGTFLDRVRSELSPLLLDDGQPIAGVHLEPTGIMPLVHGIQRQLIDDLFRSFVGALILIAIVMTLVHGSIAAGLVSMVSNVFPIVLIFGLLGWLAVPMDIGSVMTASVALGIAVDDTLHFLTFFRRGLDSGLSRLESVVVSYHHCGRAMIQTSLICGLGLLAFAASDFVPTARFAWMMTALLGTALLGDLIVLPSLLLSPLGRFFQIRATEA